MTVDVVPDLASPGSGCNGCSNLILAGNVPYSFDCLPATKSGTLQTPESFTADCCKNSVHAPEDLHDTGEIDEHRVRWIDNASAKSSVIAALTVFYAMVMTIFALVFELSRLMAGHREALDIKDLVFGLYMYGMSILFLLYCYLVLLLNPRWLVCLEQVKNVVRFRSCAPNAPLEEAYVTTETHRKVTHDGASAGSLFLRLGCISFGIVGTVYYLFNVSVCLAERSCQHTEVNLDLCAILFTFIQMHFVFCNWKIAITGSQAIARLGTMHLIAYVTNLLQGPVYASYRTNLWTWIRYVLIEEGVMEGEISSTHEDRRSITTVAVPTASSVVCRSGIYQPHASLESLSEIMYTSIVEFSLISAAVMFIVWRNINHEKTAVAYVKRKHQIRVDCSNTTTGLFFGLAFLAATFTSMTVFYSVKEEEFGAGIFAITDILEYIVAGLVSVYAMWQMRLLRYQEATCRAQSTSGQELLDMILLSLGMAGEMIYSVAGLVGLTGDQRWQTLSIALFVVHITRLAQVCLQSCLIYIAGKLRVQGDPELRNSQPGKQAVTFLLLANIAMFLMNLLESEKAGVCKSVVEFYGKKNWVFLVRSFSPLTIFYRFHSSVCLAEVWKNAYSWKG
ncbi:CRE-OTPL-1 protein [Aphelenchoides avenae]|nr:CRE-OTPL-1 protein [Aphelenchus avenae]